MPAWRSYSYLFGPVAALLAVGVLSLLLRWTFRRGGSLVERRPLTGAEKDYGLLVAVASPSTYVEGEMLRRQLTDAGLRATLATTTVGPRLLVWPQDERAARLLLGQRGA